MTKLHRQSGHNKHNLYMVSTNSILGVTSMSTYIYIHHIIIIVITVYIYIPLQTLRIGKKCNPSTSPIFDSLHEFKDMLPFGNQTWRAEPSCAEDFPYVPIEASIYMGFSIATFDHRRVINISICVKRLC